MKYKQYKPRNLKVAATPFRNSGLNTKEFTSKASLLKNLPLPLFSKEGYFTSLWQREVRRDFIINVFILMTLLVREGWCFISRHSIYINGVRRK
jgi:hypothetical protein